MDALLEKLPMILAVLLGLSEALAHIPQVQANSVFQLLSKVVKGASKLMAKKEEPKLEEKAEEDKPAE